jgi:hypothetical protein
MSVASLELSKKLYELSGFKWGITNEKQWMWVTYPKGVYTGSGPNRTYEGEDWSYTKCVPQNYRGSNAMVAPAYDVGSLQRKLPSSIPSKEHKGKRAYLTTRKDERDPDNIDKGYVYFAWYAVIGDDPSDYGVHADTPENAICKLAIELLEGGILKT